MNHVSRPRRRSAGIDPVARARDLGPEIAAAADEIERTQVIPEPLLTHIHDARLARMLLPRSVGGDQVDPWTYLHAIEEISRHDGSVGWNLFVANSAALIAPFIPLETAKAIFTDPRAWVAWGPPNQYKAQAVPGGYRVSGEWHFASGSRQANWMGAHCQVIEPDGSLRLNRFGRPTIRTLLFRKEHAEPIHDWNTDRHARHRVRGLSRHRPVRPRGLQRHPRGSVAAPRPRSALCLHDAGTLCRRRRRRRVRHRARHAGCVHRPGGRKDAARPAAPRRQSRGAGRRGSAGGSAWCRTCLAGRDPEGRLGRRRRHRPDRPERPCPRAARLCPCHQHVRSRSPTTSTRPPAPRPSSRARRSSAGSATSTPCHSRSSRGMRISRRSAG